LASAGASDVGATAVVAVAMAPTIVTVHLNDQTVIGIVATFAVAAVFYLVSGWQLRRETRRLRQLVTYVLTGLENAGIVSVRWVRGRPGGVNVTVRPQPIAVRATVHPPTVGTTPPPLPWWRRAGRRIVLVVALALLLRRRGR
jgi:ABC-type branched-subunit amino acid transport system permease subunit